MTEHELHEYLQSHFPKENERCEWKAFTNLKNSIAGSAGNDVISYVSAISNMQGGCLVLGVEDGTLNVLGIQNFHDYTPENLPNRLLGNCTNLNSEGLRVESIITDDSKKSIWCYIFPNILLDSPLLRTKKHGNEAVML